MGADFAVIVCFTVKPEHRQQFMTLLRENARTTVSDEQGCLRFDIVEPPQRQDEVWLYEIYADRAAFDTHLAASHFRVFDGETREMIAQKTVVAGRLEERTKV